MKKYRDKTEFVHWEEEFFDGTLSEILNKVQALIDRYGEDAYICHELSTDLYSDYNDLTYSLSFTRKETEEERTARLKEAKQIRDRMKERERVQKELELAEYERLKSKYG